jgi:hypothetical protein
VLAPRVPPVTWFRVNLDRPARAVQVGLPQDVDPDEDY